jgi:NADH:ubiquinone oxidoreductase subunit 3 (subunit A)
MNGVNAILLPPVAFLVFLVLGIILLGFGALISAKGRSYKGKKTQYACGEDVPAAKLQPDYSSFFPFALFFTIIHVTALIMATIPSGNIALMGILYMTGVALSLYTLTVR